MSNTFLLTIFTPVYNRANLIKEVYQSLLKQSNKNFEWVVVDDGSKDNIADVIKQMQEEHILEIKFFQQKNSGKHVAVNTGTANAEGQLFLILDSDDVLMPDAVDTIQKEWSLLKDDEKKSVSGLCFNKIIKGGTTAGGERDYTYLKTSYNTYHYKKKYAGDKAEVFRTEVIKHFPFPETEGEKFCPEALVWHRIGKQYEMLFINKGIYVCEYLEGGLTNKITKIRAMSPINTTTLYKELANDEDIPLSYRIRSVINYWRFSIYDNSKAFVEKLKNIKLWWAILLYPISYIIYLREK